VKPENIVAHSDVAPSRKQDPGEKFPWKRLAQSGIGLWVEPVPIAEGPVLKPDDTGDKVVDLQKALADYGYGIDANGTYDASTRDVVTAFQRHFRPAKADGLTDVSTRETLRKLLVAREFGPLQKDQKRAVARGPKPPAASNDEPAAP
jgi:N-acetylmuramoyl-L-alanine amidase